MWRKAIGVAILLCASQPVLAQTTIGADAYLDKLEGMWLGELIGNYAGAPREGYDAISGLNYQVNWTDPIHVDPVSGRNDYVFRDSPWQGDDDTCFEYLYMNSLKVNPDPTAAQIGQLWAGSISEPSFYVANRQGRHLISLGYSPPATGSMTLNWHWNAIDSQITTESLGATAPGMIQRGADLAGRFGSVTNSGFALHAAQYYAAMYSAAATESNVERLVAMGQSVVPTTSRTWQIIQDVRNWYTADKADGNLDWRATQALVYNRYCTASNGRYYYWVESSINTAMTTLAVLYGGGDFQKTVEIAVQAGFDADCNGATAGGLVGMIQGYSGLPADFRSRAGDGFQEPSTITGVPATATIAQIAAGYQSVAESEILLMGGSITGSGAARTYHIPNVPMSPLVEKPDPAGPKGLVGQVLALGGHVSVTASVANYDPTNDRANLNGIIDGITDVSYDGHLAYSTNDGTNHQPAGGDFYQLNFDRLIGFNSVIFYEGDVQLADINGFPDSNASAARGGWFTTLGVEVGRDGNFVPVTGLSLSEPLDKLMFYQVITLSFDPIEGNSVRIRGTAGGTDEFTTCLELEAYGFVPGAVGNQWKMPAGNWGDPNCWTGGLPGAGLGAVVVGNGGTVAINQSSAACDGLIVAQLYRESGTVNMTGGRLDSNWVAVGFGGAGNFTQSGGSHFVRQGLFIAHDANSQGTYTLTDGNLCVSGGIFVGGSQSSAGGKGTLAIQGGSVTISGGLTVWSGGTVLLSGGSLRAGGTDANARVDVLNDGLLEVTDGIVALGDLTGTGGGCTGATVVGSGATLIVANLQQDSVVVEGTLVLGGDDYVAAGASLPTSLPSQTTGPDQTSVDNTSQPVPEPGTVILLGLGAAALRRRKR